MARILFLLLVFLGMGFPVVYGGELLRCKDDAGRVTLRNESCRTGEQDMQPETSFKQPTARRDQQSTAISQPISTEDIIPFLTRGGKGQYWIPVLVNGQLTVEFLIDTGANIVVIPRNIIDKLAAMKSVTSKDWLGMTTATMADGSSGRHAMVRVDTIQIGRHVLKNMAAGVTPANGIPLLGTSALEQLGAWRIDSQKRYLSIVARGQPVQEKQAVVSEQSNHANKTMHQCWQADGKTYLSSLPCPTDGAVAAPPVASNEGLIAQCRALLQRIQATVKPKQPIANLAQLRAEVDRYNKGCPGLVYQNDSGQAELMRELILKSVRR
ncbi:MAG: retroviral-like aspartic protease family protein [Magnetococcus sp. YQC-5]